MKIISHFLLLVITVVTITACGDMGKGPSKPPASNSAELLLK
jgi:predicted small lipoprotein YifL